MKTSRHGINVQIDSEKTQTIKNELKTKKSQIIRSD